VLAAELASQFEVLAVGGGERGPQLLGLGAVALFELGDLRGERAHDVALRRRLIELWVRVRVGRRTAVLLGAKLLDAGPQGWAV